MYSLCGYSRSDYEMVKRIDLSKDGIYFEDFEYKLFAVVISGQIVLQIEKQTLSLHYHKINTHRDYEQATIIKIWHVIQAILWDD